MLSDIDKIDWVSRNAEQIPDLLSQMFSDSGQINRDAFKKFNNRVVYFDDKGTYNYTDNYNLEGVRQYLESGIYTDILPFLIELLSNNELKERYRILSILDRMSGYLELFEILELNTTLVYQLREQIWSYSEAYYPFLIHGSDMAKNIAGYVICAFTEYAESILPRLEGIIKAEQDEKIRALILSHIQNYLLQTDEAKSIAHTKFAPFLENLVKEDVSKYVRISAAILAIHISGIATSDIIIDYLVATLQRQPNDEYRQYGKLEQVVRPSYQARMLVKFGAKRGIPAAIDVVDNSEYVDTVLHTFATALLLAAYGEQPIPKHYYVNRGGSASNRDTFYFEMDYWVLGKDYKMPRINLDVLNNLQKDVLEAILRNDIIWGTKHNLFEVFHIPADREELRKMLQS